MLHLGRCKPNVKADGRLDDRNLASEQQQSGDAFGQAIGRAPHYASLAPRSPSLEYRRRSCHLKASCVRARAGRGKMEYASHLAASVTQSLEAPASACTRQVWCPESASCRRHLQQAHLVYGKQKASEVRLDRFFCYGDSVVVTNAQGLEDLALRSVDDTSVTRPGGRVIKVQLFDEPSAGQTTSDVEYSRSLHGSSAYSQELRCLPVTTEIWMSR